MRRVIELDKTNNGDPRTVHLNQDAFDAIESIRPYFLSGMFTA